MLVSSLVLIHSLITLFEINSVELESIKCLSHGVLPFIMKINDTLHKNVI